MPLTQNKTSAYERREHNRAYGLFVVSLLGALLLFMWGMCVMGGYGIGYHSPTRFGLLWGTHDLWQFLKAAALIAIAFGMMVGAVDGLEHYREVESLRRIDGELREEITQLKYGKGRIP